MDGVGTEFILNTNSEIIKPDLEDRLLRAFI